MTWTEPLNLKDNQIIGATYWNNLLGENSSLVYLERRTNEKVQCTVLTASFRKTIPAKNTGEVFLPKINGFLTNRSFPAYPNSKYFDRKTGNISLPGSTPFIALWNMSVPTATASPITIRHQLVLQRKSAEKTLYDTLACDYFYRSSSTQNRFTGVYAGIALYNGDKYWLSCATNSASSFVVSGTITIILNPSFV